MLVIHLRTFSTLRRDCILSSNKCGISISVSFRITPQHKIWRQVRGTNSMMWTAKSTNIAVCAKWNNIQPVLSVLKWYPTRQHQHSKPFARRTIVSSAQIQTTTAATHNYLTTTTATKKTRQCLCVLNRFNFNIAIFEESWWCDKIACYHVETQIFALVRY